MHDLVSIFSGYVGGNRRIGLYYRSGIANNNMPIEYWIMVHFNKIVLILREIEVKL